MCLAPLIPLTMKRLFLLGLMCQTICPIVRGQYFYKDIINTRQASSEMAVLRQAGVRTVSLKSYEADESESRSFFCERKLSRDHRKSSLYTRTGLTGRSLMESSFDEQGRLVQTYDSSENFISRTRFSYDDRGRLFRTRSESSSADEDFVSRGAEEHVYLYDESPLPHSMFRIRNGSDSLLILFSKDENDDLAIEKDTRTGAKFYYYYDSTHRLTDVVHMNEYKNKPVADYVFTYDTEGRLVRMLSTEPGSDNFMVWRYDYENGLKIRERLLSREGFLIARIEYSYKK